MKTRIAAAAAAAVVASVFVPAGDAHADNMSFLQALNMRGLNVYNAVLAVDNGWALCTALNTYSGEQVVEAWYQLTGWDVPDRATAWIWVVSAAEELCPWNDHRGEAPAPPPPPVDPPMLRAI